ncbi:MAG: RNA polymerase sigma factor [Alphaproteobacteria bacterium]|nr:RNA polymerase sigma factor [Alphaproteobacteria bacterium]
MSDAPPFQHLLAAHALRVHGAALGFMRDEQEARETAQDALLKAWRARDRYDPALPFYPWLYRIVRNTCFDALARRKHRAVPGLDAERIEIDAPDAGERIDAERSARRLKAALATLPQEQQEVLSLRHFQDLSYAEMAHLLGVPEGTVMSRLYRARKALARAMEVP